MRPHYNLLKKALLVLGVALPLFASSVRAQTPTVGVTQFIPSVNGGICGFQITFDPSGSTSAYAQIMVNPVVGSPVGLSAAALHVWTTDSTYSVPSPSGNVWNVYKGTPAGQPYSVVVQVVQSPTTPTPGSATYATGPITSTTSKTTGQVTGTAINMQTMSFESTVNSAVATVNVTMNGGGGR
jgi:hypothetical protein